MCIAYLMLVTLLHFWPHKNNRNMARQSNEQDLHTYMSTFQSSSYDDHLDCIRRFPARSSGAVDRFFKLPSPKLTRIDFRGGQVGLGGAEEQNQSTFRSVVDFKEAAMHGNPQVIDAFVGDGGYILSLTKSKTDKN